MIPGAPSSVNDWLERLRNFPAEGRESAIWLERALADLRGDGKNREVDEFIRRIESRLTPGRFVADPLVVLTEALLEFEPCGENIDPATIGADENLLWVIALDGKLMYDLLSTIFDDEVETELDGIGAQDLNLAIGNKTGAMAPANPNTDPELVDLLGGMISQSIIARNDFLSKECGFYESKCGRIWVTVDVEAMAVPLGVELASWLNDVLALDKTPCHGMITIIYTIGNTPQLRKPTWLDSYPARPFRPGQSSRGWGLTAPSNARVGISEAVHLPLQATEHSNSKIHSYGHLS